MSWTVITAIGCTVALLAAGGLATEVGTWYCSLRKPSWNPPDWLFGPVWTVILGLAGWGGVMAWDAAPDGGARTRIALLFAANAFLHFLWSPLFFKWKRPDWAFIEVWFLWASVLALAVGLWPYSQAAGWLMAPYLAWVTFAAYLNYTIVRLNAPFGATARQPAA